jgi:alpha-1,6-mannosyltransferase
MLVLCLALYGLGVLCLWSSFLLSPDHRWHAIDHAWFASLGDLTGSEVGAALARYGPPLLYGLAIVLMFAAYLLLVRVVRRADSVRRRRAFRIVLAVALLLALVPPFLSSDPVLYYQEGWILDVQGDTPYASAPADYADYPAKGEFDTQTEHHLSPYGPIWTYVSALVVRLSGGDLVLGVALFKIVGLLAYGFLFFVVLRLAAACCGKGGAVAAMCVLGNPALLVEGPGMAHNDVFALALLLLGVLLYLRGGASRALGLLVAFLGALVKVFALPGVALLALHELVCGRSLASLRTVVVGLGLGCLLAIALSLPLVGKPQLITHAFGLAGIAKLGDLSSLPTPANLASRVIGSDVAWAFYALGAIVVGWLVLREWRRGTILPAIAPAYAVGTVIGTHWRQWYALWPLALLPIGTSRLWVRLIGLYTFLAMLTHLVTQSSGVSLV